MKKAILNVSFLFLMTGYVYACPSSGREGVHIVQRGENLYRICLKYGITVENIRLWNNLTKDDVLHRCMELRVADPGVSTNPTTKPLARKATTSHKEVVKEYNVTPKAESTRVDVVYFKQPGMAHLVLKGQTIKGIANLYGYTEEYFREFNGLINGQETKEGDMLRSKECAVSIVSEPQSTPKVSTTPSTEPVKTPPVNTTPKTETPATEKAEPATNAVKAEEIIPEKKVTQPTVKSEEIIPEKEVTQPEMPKTEPGKVTNSDAAPKTQDTAKKPEKENGGMSVQELAMLEEVNLLRSNPKDYIQYVEKYVEDMKKGEEFGSTYKTAKELIKELKDATPLSILEPKACIRDAAQKHGEEMKKVGKTGHQGKDGSWPWDRITRECTDLKDGNENLVGGREDVREAVIILLIDDGIDDRGHRRTLLNSEWKYAAFYYVGQVGQMPSCWVQNYGY